MDPINRRPVSLLNCSSLSSILCFVLFSPLGMTPYIKISRLLRSTGDSNPEVY